ncbi:MAG: hypothetical protein B7X86_07510 [Sphingobacteriales bacterium 17-39-43]|uniref:hypothetical protein n=1 Tax=Daejeonella sp. TaxID=2805397 RepID=UPI000BD88BEC|nr:hypothetical protein [Daejeonella sp.]OYZ31791.1 MAG: hypothetical protein B7Y24_08115 [Sphingobacteriales bacterium 16-39-50]OZA24884.1 MAG: hypothetical protein B7X86_07510 [Sphingobacteriales bacterium 17-39-43]HQT22943.1 hypothetical protein [Daejeonella sp.]HQT57075.1 hypothetical protein [Daejeonella sp.]
MGKPFKKELEKVRDTLDWALDQPADEVHDEILHNSKKPLFVVGSGGSLSACSYAVQLYQQHGTMAKSVTPLELFYSRSTLRQSNILFISASGKNTDILFGYKTAIGYEPNKVYSLCMKKNSPLAKLASESSITKSFDYNIPSGKDGFLATNSLVAFFGILYKIFNPEVNTTNKLTEDTIFLNDLQLFISRISPDFTFTTLYGGWGQPIAVDIESKLAEAALADVLISDYRNFGHGRHHWFDKRKSNSAIIALITPDEEKLAEKTLALLPSDIPILRIKTNFTDAFASIDLLVKSFYLISELGNIQNIDPGRPGVPAFGSKLYNLKYSSLYDLNDRISDNEKIAIVRKTDSPTYHQLSDDERKYWSEAHKSFKKQLKAARFGTIVFDYDGTLCSAKNRFNGVDKEVAASLIDILEKGIVIGIATGRGKSVRKDLQKAIPEQYWSRIIIGYYNCSDIGFLSENHLPDKTQKIDSGLQEIYDMLNTYKFPVEVLPEIKPNQLTIEIKEKGDWLKVRTTIIHLIMNKNLPNIQILESSHSMDVINQNKASKLNILDHCTKLATRLQLPEACLCIGDKGQWPGNDYQLLSHPFSLSVDEVSPLNATCWNLSKPGIKNIRATLYYLSCLQFSKKGFNINIQ